MSHKLRLSYMYSAQTQSILWEYYANLCLDMISILKLLGISVHGGYQNKPMVELVLDNGADTDSTDTWGNTALHTAAAFCSDDIVKVLLNAKAHSFIKTPHGATALDLAKKRSNVSFLSKRRCAKTLDLLKKARSSLAQFADVEENVCCGICLENFDLDASMIRKCKTCERSGIGYHDAYIRQWHETEREAYKKTQGTCPGCRGKNQFDLELESPSLI